MKKIILVDDSESYLEALRFIFSQIPDVQIVGEARNGEQFLSLVSKEDCDLVFMDINMPVMSGIEATELGLKMKPELKIIALTQYTDEEYINEMLKSGVKGYLLKSIQKMETFRDIIENIDERTFFC